MEPKIIGGSPEGRGWDRLRPKIAPRWLPDLIFHVLGIFLDAFGAYFEGFWFELGSLTLQKMPKTNLIFVVFAWGRLPQNFRGRRCTPVGVFDIIVETPDA